MSCHVAALATVAIEERSRSNRGGLRSRVVILVLCREEASPPCSAIACRMEESLSPLTL